MSNHEKKELKTPPVLEGYLFPDFNEARKARDENRLLSLRVETSLKCNLKCGYCYRESGEASPEEMSYEELIAVIDQAYLLGARSIVIIGGGEPTIYEQFRSLVTHIHSKRMIPVVITNCQTMTKSLAGFLFEKNASVLIKLDSLRENVQDTLVGVEGAFKQIQKGLSNLLEAGFDSTGKVRLGASFVINRLNVDELEDVWRFLRNKNMFPNLETLTPHGRAANYPEWLLTQDEVQALKYRLLALDEKEYGYTWNPYTPLIGAGCRQLEYSCCITVEGYVRPCAAVHIDHLNVRPGHEKAVTLADSIHDPFIHRARHAEEFLQGNCGKCEYKTNECIGCRGCAFALGVLNGMDIFDAIVLDDPYCTKYKEAN